MREMETENRGELDFLWLILAILVGTYGFLFGFLKNINEWYYAIRLGKKYKSLPPGEMGWPLVGNTLSFMKAGRSKDPASFVNNLVDRYGQTGIYKISLFMNPSIVVSTPEFCRKVLTDDRFTSGYPSSSLQLIGKKSLHGVSEAEHKYLRRSITAPISGREALSMYTEYIEEIVISLLEEWANSNSPIEFLNELKKISFRVITKVFMGSTDSVPESMIKYYSELFDGFLAIPIDFPGSRFHRALKARKVLEKMIEAQVDEKRLRKTDELNTKAGLIDLLWELNDEDGGKLEDEHVVNLLIGFLLAGHETSAIVAMWLTIYLHDRPEMLQKAREEQLEIIKRRPSSQKGLTINEIKQMDFLSKAIDETMRLCGVPLMMFRKANEDVEINGYIIPKGWKVLVSNRAVHMNSEIYSNPNEFLPSRWDNYKPKGGSFLPFGAGSRSCPGADLAKTEICIILHHFLLNYKFVRINPNCPMRYPFPPTPVDNCLARITKLP